MASISSRKSERAPGSRNGRSRRDFNGRVMDQFGIVFSNGSLILNMTDGERTWSLILSEEETATLAQRFKEVAR